MGPPPRHQVVTSAKDAVASGVTGVVGLARQSRRWSVELKRSMSHAVDVVLGKSEELVDHFLPMTEEELGEAHGRLPPAPGPPPAQGPSPEATGQRALGFTQGHMADQQETRSRGPSPTARSTFVGPPACALLETTPPGPQEYKRPIDLVLNW